MNHLRLLLPTLLLLASTVPALAAPGDLDLGFNGTGFVVTVVPTGYSQATSIARQTDGKVVVAGAANVPVQGNPDNLDFLVVRYDTAGGLDSSFGGTGIVTTAIRGGDDQAEAVIQQTDGKIVAAGLSYDGTEFNDSTVTLVRYLDNGTLDPNFGGGTGKVTTAIGTGTYDGALALIQQADGKLVVAGYTDTDIVVVRYDTSGMPDTSFSGTGIVTTTVGMSASANAVVEQAGDHKLVVAGSFAMDPSPDTSIVLVRYGTTGAPDTTFNGTGIVTTPVGMGSADARALVQQASDGKLVVAGVSNDGTEDQFTLIRYGTDGMLDTAGFGTGGIVTTSVGTGDAAASGLALQADGKLVAAGQASNGTNTDFALVRYDTSGTPDGTFGSGGIVTTPIVNDDAAAAIVYQPDGFLVVAGFAMTDVAVARYVGIEGIVTTTTTTIGSTTTTPGSTTTSTTTTIGSTTTTPGSTTTSTTLLNAALVPGGPPTKKSSDCYLELLVAGAQTSDVQGNKLLVCKDGDPCDAGAAGDDRCDLKLAGCVNQSDPALPDCTAPATLASARIRGKVAIAVSALLAGPPQCTPFVDASVVAKRNKRGKYLAGKSKLVLKGLAKAAKGVSPRKDADKWTIQCMPAS
jgi:uncharacterized delta-60 repeat protein